MHFGVVTSSSSSHQCLIALIVGLVFGFSITQILVYLPFTRPKWVRELYEYSENLHPKFIDHDDYQDLVHKDTFSLENYPVAQKLYGKVRVLCWILTGPKNHQRKAMYVKRTWGKHCNKLLFMSSVEDKNLGTVKLNVSEGRHWLWDKTKEAFKYIYDHHLDDADWFFKADDDTYAIMENMRYLLYPYSPETPIYFGAKLNLVKPNGYMSGGAGYVLSKEAVRRFVTVGVSNPNFCIESHSGVEDIRMAECLQNINVTAGDSRDSDARSRFFPFKPSYHIKATPDPKHWYWKNIFYKTEERMDRVSNYAISFHYIDPWDMNMHVLEYFLYHLKIYGIVNTPAKLPKRLKIGEISLAPTLR